MNFLKYMFATLLALFIFSGLGFLLFIGWIGFMTAEDKVVLKDDTILHLKLDKPIAERGFDDPFSDYVFGGSSNIGILDLKDAIAHAGQDEKVKGIFLDLNFLSIGFGRAYELRQSLMDFKESGKFIVAYSDYMSEGSYYVASVADSIFLQPVGNLEFNGLSYQVTFFKGALDKLDVNAQIFRVGDYKSAVEPFMRKDMSEDNKIQVASFINDIYNTILEEIAEARNMDANVLGEISAKMKVRSNEDAVELGLADGIRYSDEVFQSINVFLDKEIDSKVNLVTFGKYRNSYSNNTSSKNRIAVIIADGEIMFGDGDQNVIGADKFVEEIRKARKSSRVKAIVLRINSPGGNFIASDDLWREIKLASSEKPVVASMSNYAASGGYYMAMAADTIVAYPNTITGSIGIFSILFDMSAFLENKLGITSDGVKTGEFSDILTASRPLTDYERSIYQSQAESGYETFVAKAAEGRNLEVEEIKRIASGRVWTGTQALNNGLVDVLGGFDDAVRIAADMANLADDYKISLYPEQKSYWEQIISELGGGAKVKMIKAESGELYPYFQLLQKLKSYRGVQARMPFEITTSF